MCCHCCTSTAGQCVVVSCLCACIRESPLTFIQGRSPLYTSCYPTHSHPLSAGSATGHQQRWRSRGHHRAGSVCSETHHRQTPQCRYGPEHCETGGRHPSGLCLPSPAVPMASTQGTYTAYVNVYNCTYKAVRIKSLYMYMQCQTNGYTLMGTCVHNNSSKFV